jgi:CRP-like cAMP-binding protein
MWELLLKNIANKEVFLSSEEVEIVKSSFTHKKLRKHQYILQEGEIATHDNFIVEGLARTFRIDENGQEHITKFTPEDWWAGDLASFLSNKPTVYNIDCLEDTQILRITHSDLETLFERVPKMNKYFRLLYQRSIISYNLRLSSALSKSALDRYEEFLKSYANIDERVPNHQIASYLGITPQSLSRLRKQSMQKPR